MAITINKMIMKMLLLRALLRLYFGISFRGQQCYWKFKIWFKIKLVIHVMWRHKEMQYCENDIFLNSYFWWQVMGNYFSTVTKCIECETITWRWKSFFNIAKFVWPSSWFKYLWGTVRLQKSTIFKSTIWGVVPIYFLHPS